ncbi:MAG: hypothetical protein KAV82_09400, partial [Phycisphaerae bacterium]|nr:hypothetical protein [Phycisphaerae bacterium]
MQNRKEEVMMYVRNKAMPWIGVSLALCAMVACSVTVTQEPDGITGTITIANQKIAFSLNVLDPFQITANAPPVPQAARINLYDGTPKAVPENAQLTLEAADVQAIMLAPLKAVPRSQTLTGSAQVNVSIGAYDGNPCAEGTYIGSFHVTFSGGSVAIDQVNLDIPADVLTTILTGSFSICLQVSADIGVQITIAGMGVQFGPPIDEACALDSDCPAGETCVNGVCVSGAEPECVFNSDCATGETCVNGECVAGTAPECEFDSDCAAGEACVNGECVSDTTPECVFDSDCATGETC